MALWPFSCKCNNLESKDLKLICQVRAQTLFTFRASLAFALVTVVVDWLAQARPVALLVLQLRTVLRIALLDITLLCSNMPSGSWRMLPNRFDATAMVDTIFARYKEVIRKICYLLPSNFSPFCTYMAIHASSASMTLFILKF